MSLIAMGNTIFSVELKHLRSLNPTEGVCLVRDLLWAEARKALLPPHRVVISLNESAKDGGIDAKVEAVPFAVGLLDKGDSFFQIKTGVDFKPWRISDLRKELFGKSASKPSKILLGQAVASCLDLRGRYVLVTLGHDLLPQQHINSVATLRTLFRACGYPKARVDVVGVGQLIALLQDLPSLCLELTGRSSTTYQTVATWKSRADMQLPLSLAAPQQQFIAQLQALLRGSDHQHCRVIGEPGLGKTRLVLEAICAPDICPSTLYVPTGEDLQRSNFLHELLKNDRNYSVTLVVDDCDEKDRASIWAAVKGKDLLKLVTLDHGPETSADNLMRVLQFPPLPDKQVEEILAGYTGEQNDLRKWAEWCSGSPRVAHAVGANLRQNPDDILKPPATVDLWERFVVGHKAGDSTTREQIFTVLRYLALVERFGFEPPVQEEARFLSKLVTCADPSITWPVFQRIIRRNKNRRILQGRHTLFFVPKALHVYLWLSFWQNHGNGFDVDEFLESSPPGLVNGFMRMFVYAHGSSVAGHVVKALLSPTGGPYRNRDFLVSEQGTRFLNSLAEADPNATLRLLESSFGRWGREELKAWEIGRQNVVSALEKIAVWQDCFPRAARLLARLATAENSRNSNNAVGVMKALFAIGPEWSPTQTPPSDRFQLLEQLVRSDDGKERELGLILCRQWLSTHGPLRVIGAEYQGLRPTIQFWCPKTYGEWFDEWRRVWRFLKEESRYWTPADKRIGTSLLIHSASELVRYNAVSNEVIDSLFELADDPAVDRKELVHLVIHCNRFHSPDFSKTTADRLKQLDRRLTGSSFGDRLARFVIFTTWEEDYEVDEGKVFRVGESAERVKKLAAEFRTKPKLWKQHLRTLVCSDGNKLFQFGSEVARGGTKADLDEAILRAIEDSVANANGLFFAGYFAGLRETEPERTDELQLRVVMNPVTRMIGVECAWRSDPSEAVLRQLLKLYKKGQVPSTSFSRIGLTARRSGISKALVDQLARALMAREDAKSHEVCIELYDHYYLHEKSKSKMQEGPVLSLLASDKFFGQDDCSMGYHWYRVASRFLEQYPNREIELFSIVVEYLQDVPGTRSADGPTQLADDIAKCRPRETWGVIRQLLERGVQRRFALMYWLRDNGFEDRPELGAIRYFDPIGVMKWIREEPRERVRLVASFVPKTLDPDQGGMLTRMLIDEFGDEEDLAEHLQGYFWMGGWSGPESEYLSRKRDEARRWLSHSSSRRVSEWLNRYLDYLSSLIEEARIKEERDW